jgi:phage terminase large subunit GpA-like protein
MMVVQPTQKVGKKWTKQRFKPMRDEMPELRELVKDPRSRESGNTADMKEFPGGMLSSPARTRRRTCAPRRSRSCTWTRSTTIPPTSTTKATRSSSRSSAPTNFPRRKILKTSSPTTKGASRIEVAYLASDQCRYHVPCPHCQEPQPLIWSQLKWDEVTYGEAERTEQDDSGLLVDVRRAYYVCSDCAARSRSTRRPGCSSTAAGCRGSPAGAMARCAGFI